MASNIFRFITLWLMSASYIPGSRGGHHPLCRTLDNLEQQQPTQFPSVYTCHGDGNEAMCTSRETKIDGARAEKEEPGGVTWWVYGSRSRLVSDPEKDFTADEWICCTDYCAHSSPVLGSNNVVGDPPQHGSGSMRDVVTTTQRVSAEPVVRAGGNVWSPRCIPLLSVSTPSAVSTKKGTTRRLPISQELRALEADGAHGSAGIEISATHLEIEGDARIKSDKRRSGLVYAPNTACDDLWLSWPAMQDRAIARGTVVVFDMFASVGNLFLAFNTLMKFVRLLELGLILEWNVFPGFRRAFNPGEINWSIDAEPFMQHVDGIEGGAAATGLHKMKFSNFAMVLSDSQLELLALTLNINETNTEALATHFRKELPNRMNTFMSHVMRGPLEGNKALDTQPCTWNMLLTRSPSMIASLAEHSPWGMVNGSSELHHQNAEYIAWQIRTPDGETARSYTPKVHQYVVQEPPSDVCPTYLGAMEDALHHTRDCASLSNHTDDELVFISSNSKPMAKACTVEAEKHDVLMGHVDLGLNSSDAHTKHSKNPLQTALGAFLDFFFLLDSTVIVRTGSSFSGTVVSIKGLHCQGKVYDSLPNRKLFICLPSDC